MKLCYFLNRSSIVLRSRIEERTKVERRIIEGWSKTEREPIEDLSKSYRRAIEDRTRSNRIPKASRTHPEGKQSDSIRKNAPKDTTFIPNRSLEASSKKLRIKAWYNHFKPWYDHIKPWYDHFKARDIYLYHDNDISVTIVKGPVSNRNSRLQIA